MKSVYQNIHQDIIDRCKEGDSNAQLQLYKLYYKAMFNTSLRIVKDRTEAEDIMQESFLDAFSKLNSYKGDAAFGAWLKRIVINNSLDLIKKRKLDTEPLDGQPVTDYGSDIEEGDKEAKYSLEAIKKAIAELPDGYRTILSLYLLEGYDHEEIADIMKITSSTSRSQYNRARKKLQEILTTTQWQIN